MAGRRALALKGEGRGSSRLPWLSALGRRLVCGWRGLPATALPNWVDAAAATRQPDFASFFENMVDGAFRSTSDGRLVAANRALAGMLGYADMEEFLSVNIIRQLYVNSADREAVVEHLVAAGEVRNAELRLRRKDGQQIVVLENSRAVRDAAGETLYYEGILTDVTELKQAQDLFRTVASHAPMAIFIVQDGVVRFVNPQFVAMTGYPEAALVGGDGIWLIAEEERSGVQAAAAAMLRGERTQPYEFRLVPRSGGVRWVLGTMTAIDYRGRPAALGTFTDITDRKHFEEELTRQAFFDSLTGLPNRNLFIDRLEHGLGAANRRHEQIAVMFLDLDGFKAVNDRLGHAAGDELLLRVASRLQEMVRGGDTIARFGGDEFTILLEAISVDEDALAVARRIVAGLEAPFAVAGHDVTLSASIGLAFGRPGGPEAGELLRQADIALYAAKTSGKRRYMVFSEGMSLRAA
ncbi:MAG: diguanylate cyclase [Dehalococcoidia bacterium]|nr:diguanylate cyclase [Dehalococcoidia bacterium]